MAQRICEGVFLVGGPDLTASSDCLCYLVNTGAAPVLIDCGAGPGLDRLLDHVAETGCAALDIETLVLTHAHIDHAGAAAELRRRIGCRIVAHHADADAIEEGDRVRSAAHWYGTDLEPAPVDFRVTGKSHRLGPDLSDLVLLHTPGHTPGSLVAVLETEDGHRVLFGQDIHGPFSPDFGSDIDEWKKSMRDLIALDADILCEGHYGVFHGRSAVREFIEDQLAAHV